jgi:osmotically-inducible protein OsmY
MKTDLELKHDVEAELAWNPDINAAAIGVAVKDGVVTLTGHLDTYGEKFAIERALRGLHGVSAIALEFDVKLAPHHQRTDSEIAGAIEHALRWNTHVPADRIRVTVERGHVTLTGEVEWNQQRLRAETVAHTMIGVTGITNHITLHPRATEGDVQTGIEQALKRQAEREARRVQVEVKGPTVRLSGMVHSWQERDAAAGAAWSAPGVCVVINDLRVGQRDRPA